MSHPHRAPGRPGARGPSTVSSMSKKADEGTSMTNQNVNQATVRRTMLKNKSAAESLSALDAVCSAGAQCSEVQGEPSAQAALLALQNTVKTAHSSLSSKEAIAKALMAA